MIVLEGAPNFRDLGGIACDGGNAIRPGRIYRSDVLSRLTAADLNRVASVSLDVRLVCDLRSTEERMNESNRWPQGRGVQTVVRDIDEDMGSLKPNHWTTCFLDPEFDGVLARRAMIHAYRTMPKAFARPLAALFAHLEQQDSGGVLIHCVAGKDRTGFVCAMLLWALGAPMDSILDDYLLSAENFARTGRLEELLSGLFGDEVPVRAKGAAAVIGTVRREYLEAAFDEIGSEFGSVDDYLACAAGLTPERRAQLKKHLLIDPQPPQGASASAV